MEWLYTVHQSNSPVHKIDETHMHYIFIKSKCWQSDIPFLLLVTQLVSFKTVRLSHIAHRGPVTTPAKCLLLCKGQVKLTGLHRYHEIPQFGPVSSVPSLSHSHTSCVTMSKYVCVCRICHRVIQSYMERSVSHTVKETLPRGRLPIPNRLTVSAAGNPPAHKEARYDTTALQAREGARDSIDTASTFVWENP